MNLRQKILIPITSVLFIMFTLVIIFLAVEQYYTANKNLDLKIENMSGLVAMTNTPNVWNSDKTAMQENLNQFLIDREIVQIEILDVQNSTIIKADKTEKKPQLFIRSIEINHEGYAIGTVKATFTNYFIKKDIAVSALKLFITGFIIFVIITIILLFLSNYIAKPLIKLSDMLKNISEGEGDLTKRISISTNDEIGLTAKFFNNFLEKLTSIIKNLKFISLKNKEVGDKIGSNSQEVSTTVTQIAKSINNMKERIILFTERIISANKSVDNINNFIKNVKVQIQNQSASVSESSNAIEEMIASINNIAEIAQEKGKLSGDLVALAKTGGEHMQSTVGSINEIYKSSELILEMTKVINDVADKTNLLAMNAAIEAAHAGEFGKGFSVVADEIRNLSEQTGQNAKIISESINNVVEIINVSSKKTKETNNIIFKIIEGIGSLSESMNEMKMGMQETNLGSKQIIEALTELVSITQKVQNSSDEMSLNTTEIHESINYITTMAQENNNNMLEINSGINEITKSMNELSDLCRINSDSVKNLDSEITKFKTE